MRSSSGWIATQLSIQAALQGVMRSYTVCRKCNELQKDHDRLMDEFIGLVDWQVPLLRQGQVRAARDLDANLCKLKAKRETAINTLLAHQHNHT